MWRADDRTVTTSPDVSGADPDTDRRSTER